MVLKYHGKEVSIGALRSAIGLNRNGADAASIVSVARAYGLSSRGVAVDGENIGALPRGTILHWERHHFVVLEKARGRTVDIVDPALGRRSISVAQFNRAFSGVALICEPTENFKRNQTVPEALPSLIAPLRTHGLDIARICATAIITACASVALPMFVRTLLDLVVQKRDYLLFAAGALAYVGAQGANVWARIVRASLVTRVTARREHEVMSLIVRHGGCAPDSVYERWVNSSAPVLSTRASLTLIVEVTLAVVCSAVTIAMSVKGAVLVASVAVTRLGVMLIVERWEREKRDRDIERQSSELCYQTEVFDGTNVLRTIRREPVAARMSNSMASPAATREEADPAARAVLNVAAMLSSGTMAAFGAVFVLRGSLSTGTAVALIWLAELVVTALRNTVAAWRQLRAYECDAERVRGLVDYRCSEGQSRLARPKELKGALTVDAVSFGYGVNGPWVIKDVSLVIPGGSCVAFVGRSGCGKSTLARLLSGQYVPTDGRILVDGNDVGAVEHGWVRRRLTVVTQDAGLITGSILCNIALGDREIGFDAVVRAARLACIHDDIVAMPMKYETTLADQSGTLSGGQRQQLAIARALVQRPAVLVLDEATSQLDSITEAQLYANLASLHCTTIIVSHRVSTLRRADDIVLLDAGAMIARGQHDELLQSQVLYTQLVNGYGPEM